MLSVFLRLAILVLFAFSTTLAPAAEPQRNLEVAPTTSGKRIALVIGNAAYPGVGALRNPANDAGDIAARLKRLGFDVILRTDARQKDMLRALTEFGNKVQPGTEALFFYAGHGMQVRGKNYLIPIDAEIHNESAVSSEAVDVDQLLDKLAPARLSLVILDACRNNPFERSFRGGGQGLAQINAPSGTLIAYATAPGRVAADGEGRNGLYTSELLAAMDVPGIKIEDVFKRVRANVVRKSNEAQTPWESSSLTGDFYFREGDKAAGDAIGGIAPSGRLDPAAIELEFWRSVERGGSLADFREYLKQYPRGKFAGLARTRVDSFKTTPGKPGTEKPSPAVSNSLALAARFDAAMDAWGKGDMKMAVTDFRYVADRGFGPAQNNLGFLYLKGEGVPQDYTEAAKWFRKAAEQGLAGAQANLGAMYAAGAGVAKDAWEAAKWLRAAADQGDAKGQHYLARLYDKGEGVAKDQNEAAKWYRRAADQGNAEAQNDLGFMYAKGVGVPQSDAEALAWFRKAAELGNPVAQVNLGKAYEGGWGVAANPVEALAWYRKSASQDNAEGIYRLGRMHDSGTGVPQDPAEAVRLFRQAAEKGYAGAQMGLGFMLTRGRGVAKDPVEGTNWFRKAAEQGDSEGQFGLAEMLDGKLGIPENRTEAARWYAKAAEQGNTEAQTRLAKRLMTGSGVAVNLAEGLRWARAAADKGHAEAQMIVGIIYAQGMGVATNYAEAANWFRLGANQGHMGSQELLGQIYSIGGNGLERNMAEAAKWMRMAASQGSTVAREWQQRWGYR
ncbi:MAG: caspase family protein [Sulfuritalea sp.]|nr:caspase family protein [Sulfuritalea sp.]